MNFEDEKHRNLCIILTIEYISVSHLNDNSKNGLALEFVKSGCCEKILGDEMEKFKLAVALPSICKVDIPQYCRELCNIIINGYDTQNYDNFGLLMLEGFKLGYPSLFSTLPTINLEIIFPNLISADNV
jgi:hypothetical protein